MPVSARDDLPTWPMPGIEHVDDPVAYARDVMEDTFGHFEPVVFLVDVGGRQLRCEWAPAPLHPLADDEARAEAAELDANPEIERDAADPTTAEPHPMPLRVYRATVSWVAAT